MLNMSWIHLNQEILPVTIRALRSITRDQVTAAVEALAARGSHWNVDQHDDYDGYVSLVITNGASNTTFVISGTVDRIEVAELRDDEIHQLGADPTMSEALLRL